MYFESLRCLLPQWTPSNFHLCQFASSMSAIVYVCVNLHGCDWYCDLVCEWRCGLNVLTRLSCFAAPVSGGRVIQVLECEVPIELWKWELSREMGIAPHWFVTFAMLFGLFSVCMHHSFNQNVCVACVPVVTLCDRARLSSMCVCNCVCG